MKQLILVRHAKAMKSKEGLPDFVRSLIKKGIKQVKNISKKLKKIGIIPEVFISSPANRALETAQYFARVFGYSRKKIILKDELYGPLSDQEHLSLVKELNDNLSSVIIFGHDPATSSFVKFLGKNFNENMPTCSVAVLVFEKDSWKDIAKGQGEIIFYEYPKRLAKYYTELKAKVESEVFTQLIEVFNKTDEKAVAVNENDVKNWAKKVAKKFTKALKKFRKKEKNMKKVTKKITKKVTKKVEQKTAQKKVEQVAPAEKTGDNKPEVTKKQETPKE